MRFRDLAIGDTFDWINPMARERSLYRHRYVKVSAAHYQGMYYTPTAEYCYRLSEPMTVGTVNASVFSVMRADDSLPSDRAYGSVEEDGAADHARAWYDTSAELY